METIKSKSQLKFIKSSWKFNLCQKLLIKKYKANIFSCWAESLHGNS